MPHFTVLHAVCRKFHAISGLYNITKVQPQPSGESSKVKVKVRINNNGLFNVQSATMVEKLEDKQNEQEPESMETENNGKEGVS